VKKIEEKVERINSFERKRKNAIRDCRDWKFILFGVYHSLKHRLSCRAI